MLTIYTIANPNTNPVSNTNPSLIPTLTLLTLNCRPTSPQDRILPFACPGTHQSFIFPKSTSSQSAIFFTTQSFIYVTDTGVIMLYYYHLLMLTIKAYLMSVYSYKPFLFFLIFQYNKWPSIFIKGQSTDRTHTAALIS